jgi:myo-inositol-1(or 4)-monophosphatase
VRVSVPDEFTHNRGFRARRSDCYVRDVTDSSIRAQLPELLALATEVATEAAALVERRRRDGISVADTKSSSVDVVTEVDRESERFIRARLAEARPDDGFFGEETGAAESRSGLTWVVDPIDGTVNYLYGLQNYSVSIAGVLGDPGVEPTEFEILVGAVVSPELGDTFTAIAGGGAWLNGEPLVLGAGPADLERTLVATGFSYRAERRVMQARTFERVIGEVRDLRRLGVASLDLCNVAAGRVDAYYEFGINPWDFAGGALVAREAGAEVTGLRADEREGRRGLVAAHPAVAAQLRELLAEATDPGLLA